MKTYLYCIYIKLDFDISFDNFRKLIFEIIGVDQTSQEIAN